MNNKNLDKWNEWFAGLTDGDGCFYINKKEHRLNCEVIQIVFVIVSNKNR